MFTIECGPARHALFCFSLSGLVFMISLFSSSFLGYSSELWTLTYWGPAFYFCLVNFILRYCLTGFAYDVAVRSSLLGLVFAAGLYFATNYTGYRMFGIYVMVLSMFHFSEFMSVALTNPRSLTIDSFILNHSFQYWTAAGASWAEAAIEYYFFPGMKSLKWLSNIGLLLCIGGEVLRKLAMFTAKTNFNHHVQTIKMPDHRLVKNGVYAICRHPSYVGWFYWSVGTQIILLNPVCIIIYTLVSWSFFYDRIFAEETFLVAFFGVEYLEYQRRVPTGLPFINGYIPDEEHW